MDDNDFDLALRLGDLDAPARLYDDPEVVRSLLPAVPTMRSASREIEVVIVYGVSPAHAPRSSLLSHS